MELALQLQRLLGVKCVQMQNEGAQMGEDTTGIAIGRMWCCCRDGRAAPPDCIHVDLTDKEMLPFVMHALGGCPAEGMNQPSTTPAIDISTH